MSPTTPVRLLVPILCALVAAPVGAQVPAPTDLPIPTNPSDSAWRAVSAETTEWLASSIEAVEKRVIASRDEAAWHQMDCNSTKLAELRGLRRAAVDATAKIARALAEQHTPLVRQQWERLLVTRAHGPLVLDEAMTCNDVRRDDLDQVSIVRVKQPAWAGDDRLGERPVTHAR